MRSLSVPAMVAGVAAAIAFLKFYGVVTRPDVPTPVAIVVGQFAPGVEIGATVDDVKRSVAGLTYVPHLGFVGLPGERPTNLPGGDKIGFSQVRLLLDEPTRSQQVVNPKKARIDAVEIVSTEGRAPYEITNALGYLFHKLPTEGCITSDDESLREVRLWMTRNDRGGIALITNFGDASPRYPGLTITSVIAFRGTFAGSGTLRANYTESPCSKVLDSR